MNNWNFVLSWVEHEKFCFITSGHGFQSLLLACALVKRFVLPGSCTSLWCASHWLTRYDLKPPSPGRSRAPTGSLTACPEAWIYEIYDRQLSSSSVDLSLNPHVFWIYQLATILRSMSSSPNTMSCMDTIKNVS